MLFRSKYNNVSDFYYEFYSEVIDKNYFDEIDYLDCNNYLFVVLEKIKDIYKSHLYLVNSESIK